MKQQGSLNPTNNLQVAAQTQNPNASVQIPNPNGAITASGGYVGQPSYESLLQLPASEPTPSIALRVFNSEGCIEMELSLDLPTAEQVNAVFDIFRSTRRMQ